MVSLIGFSAPAGSHTWLCNNSSRTYLAVFPFIKAREILSKESREGGITGVKRTV